MIVFSGCLGNGRINFTEFMITLSVSSRGSVEEKLDWAFRMYDVNGDSGISMEELTDIINVRSQI